MKNLTVVQFEKALRDNKITIKTILGQTPFTFFGAMEGSNEILFRVTGL